MCSCSWRGANRIRKAHFGSEIHLCTICNGKSGKCSEDCAFCSQSAFSKTKASVYPLMNREELMAGGEYASEMPINRYAVVTSGRGLPTHEVAGCCTGPWRFGFFQDQNMCFPGHSRSRGFSSVKESGSESLSPQPGNRQEPFHQHVYHPHL